MQKMLIKKKQTGWEHKNCRFYTVQYFFFSTGIFDFVMLILLLWPDVFGSLRATSGVGDFLKVSFFGRPDIIKCWNIWTLSSLLLQSSLFLHSSSGVLTFESTLYDIVLPFMIYFLSIRSHAFFLVGTGDAARLKGVLLFKVMKGRKYIGNTNWSLISYAAFDTARN